MSALLSFKPLLHPFSVLDKKQIEQQEESVTTLCDSLEEVNLVDELIYVDWLKPNPNLTKYSKKLIKNKLEKPAAKVSTRAWNGDTVNDEDLIKFRRAKDRELNKKHIVVSNARSKADKFIKKRIKNSMKKSKHEFKFNADGTVDFQFTIQDIVKYVTDVIVLITNLSLNPSISNFISMSYLLVRIYSSDTTFTNIRMFFTQVFDRYFTSDLIKKRNVKIRDYVEEAHWPSVTSYDLQRLVNFIDEPKKNTFPLFEGEFDDNHLIEGHLRMWQRFVDTHKDIFQDVDLLRGLNKTYMKIHALATREAFCKVMSYVLLEHRNVSPGELSLHFNAAWHYHKWDVTGGLTIDEYMQSLRDFSNSEGIVLGGQIDDDSLCKIFRFVEESLTNLSAIETAGNDYLSLFTPNGDRYDHAKLQGAKEELIDNFLKVVTNKDSLVFDDSEFGKASRKAMSIFSLAPFVMMAGGINSLDEYDRWYEKRLGKADTAISAISVIGTWLYTFLKSGLPYMISKDTIFLNPVKDFEKWIEISERVYQEISDKPTLTTIANKNDYDKLCTLVSVLGKSGRDLLKASSKIPYVSSKIQGVLSKLTSLYPLLRNYYKGKKLRTTPLGVFVYGPPGAGKSSVIHTCAALFAENLGITDHKNAVYNINTSTKHLDGYREEQIGLLDDVGSANPKTTPEEIVANLCKICSEFSVVTPQAELADKGGITYNFKVMLATSNFVDGNFRQVMNNPSAGLRRFEIYIEVKVRNEHSLTTGYATQVRNDAGRIPISEIHTYSVFRPIVINNEQYTFREHEFEGRLLIDIDYKTLCRFLRNYHLRFMERSEVNVQATDAIISSKWCEEHECLRHVCTEEGRNCNGQYQYQPQASLNHLYQFMEIVNVNEFDFKRFRDVPFAENMVEQCLMIIERQVVDDEQVVDEGVIANINRAIRMRKNQEARQRERDGVVDGVIAEGQLQSWIGKKVKGIVTYPIRYCVRAVVNDTALQEDLRRNFEEQANSLVNTLTQEPQLQTITSNAVAANLPVVTELVKAEKKKLFEFTLGTLGIAAGVVTGFFILYKSVSAFVGYISKPVNKLQFSGIDDRSNQEDYLKTYKQTDAQIGAMESERPPHPITRPMVMKPQALTLTRLQRNQQQPFRELIDNSVVEFQMQIGTAGKRGVGVMIGSNIMLTTAHGFKSMPDKAVVKLVVYTYNNKYIMPLTKSHICFFEGRDLCAFSTGYLMCKEIKRILPKKDSTVFEGHIQLVRSETDPMSPHRASVVRHDGFYRPSVYTHDNDYTYFNYNVGDFETIDGDCGCPIVSTGESSSLIGLHCGALNTGWKFLVRVYEDDLEFARNWILKNTSTVTPNSMGDEVEGLKGYSLQSFKPGSFAEHIQGFATPVGWVKTKSTLRSKIRKSLVYDYIKDIKHKIPDFQSYTDFVKGTTTLQYVNPVLTKFRAIEDSPRMINPLLIDKARVILSNIMEKWCDWDDIRPASMHNVLNGIPGTVSGGINLSTAPGPRYKVHLKRDLVIEGDEPGQRVFKEEVYENMFRALQAYVRKETAGFVSMWFPKDELITPEKELSGRQRYVSLTPFEKLVLTLMALKNVFIEIRRSGKAHMAVGINAADPLQWGGFVERMRTKDQSLSNLVDGDYKFYDAYIWFVTLILGLIINKLKNNVWYNTEIRFYYRNEYVDMTMLELLTSVSGDVAQYFIIVDGVMVFVVNVTESGAACTAEINSVMESFLHILIYILCYVNHRIHESRKTLTFEAAVAGLPDFEDNVELVNYGDDNFDCCTDQIKYFYNPKSRTDAAKQLGFPITDARKNPELSFVKIHEIVFLKRRFRFDEELKVWMAPLDETSIRKLMAFVKGSSNTLEVLTVNNVCDGHLQFYMYGRSKFEEEDMLLYIDLAQAGLTRYIKSWPDFDTLTEDYLKGVLAMGNL